MFLSQLNPTATTAVRSSNRINRTLIPTSATATDTTPWNFRDSLNCNNGYKKFNNIYKPKPVIHRNTIPEGQSKSRIRINVSGMIFELWLADLKKHPNTLLGCPVLRNQYFDSKRNEYFFDRHRVAFEGIFHYYKYGGRLKRPYNVPPDIFLQEIEFYRIEQNVIGKYHNDQGHITNKALPILPTNVFQKKVWMLLEYPQTSGQAYAIALLSVMFTIISVAVYCIETVPGLKQTCINTTQYNFMDGFFITESVCNVWFTLEVLARISCCPDKVNFFKQGNNIVDVISLLPYYATLGRMLGNFSGVCADGRKSGTSLSVLRVVRLVRIFSLTKHSSGLQVLMLALRASLNGLGIFLVAIAMCVLLFSSAVYYIEMDVPNSDITSIPDAFWWSIITMCTVGYGDMVPRSHAGRIVGSICAVSGVLMLAIAVPIISENFNKFYTYKTGRGRF